MIHTHLYRRVGFTLVEVALAVAVGLIILAGAITGYNAVKDSAASSDARRRVQMANGMIAEYFATNSGNYPVSDPAIGGGSFSNMWKNKYPNEYNISPWGGQTSDTTDGVTELTPYADGAVSPASAPDHSTDLTLDSAQAANLIYVSVTGNRWVKLQQWSNPTAINAKGYAISIYDRTGNPWYHLEGGK